MVLASLSQDGFQYEGFWEVGRTYYGLASPPSLTPPTFCWLVFGSGTIFLIRTSYCKTTQPVVIITPDGFSRWFPDTPFVFSVGFLNPRAHLAERSSALWGKANISWSALGLLFMLLKQCSSPMLIWKYSWSLNNTALVHLHSDFFHH